MKLSSSRYLIYLLKVNQEPYMPILVLNEEDFLLLSTLPETTARKSLRHILLGQSVVCYVGPCGTVTEVILYDVWSYGGADHGPLYGWRQLVNLSQNSER